MTQIPSSLSYFLPDAEAHGAASPRETGTDLFLGTPSLASVTFASSGYSQSSACGTTNLTKAPNGTYEDGVFRATLQGRMHVPDRDKVIQVLTAQAATGLADGQRQKNPDGTVTIISEYGSSLYTVYLGYTVRFKTQIDDEAGSFTVSWKMEGAQPQTYKGEDVQLFSVNEGFWQFTPVAGCANLYNVNFSTTTQTIGETAIPGIVIVSITNNTLEDRFNRLGKLALQEVALMP